MGAYLPRSEDDLVGRLELCLEATIKAEPIDAKMRDAQKAGKLPQRTLADRREAAAQQGIITIAEREHLIYTDRLKRDCIKVDDFEHDLSRATKGEDAAWQQDPKKKVAAAST